MDGDYKVLFDVNEWFGELQNQFNDIVVIGGNHDRTLGKGDMLGFKLFTNAIYLESSKVVIDDKLIWGCAETPWSHEYIANMFAFGKLLKNMSFKGMPKNAVALFTVLLATDAIPVPLDTAFPLNASLPSAAIKRGVAACTALACTSVVKAAAVTVMPLVFRCPRISSTPFLIR